MMLPIGTFKHVDTKQRVWKLADVTVRTMGAADGSTMVLYCAIGLPEKMFVVDAAEFDELFKKEPLA